MKEVIAYRDEYFVVDCPHCEERYYLNIKENIPENGRKMRCKKCNKVFLIIQNF